MDEILKYSLFLDKRDVGIKNQNGTYGTQNEFDWYINIPITTTFKLVDSYVQTYLDPFKTTMPRQMINPYFIEYGFFENVDSVSGNTGSDITSKANKFGITINT